MGADAVAGGFQGEVADEADGAGARGADQRLARRRV